MILQPDTDSWEQTLDYLQTLLGKRPADLHAVLFLIGVQELGQGPGRFTKEDKEDLMQLGVCRLLSLDGHYVEQGKTERGWPHYVLVKPIPYHDFTGQETYLKTLVIRYFTDIAT